MTKTISREQPFQVLATNFSISPSSSGYTLQISADGVNYTDLFSVGANITRMVTGVANGSYYRLRGNTDTEVVINWRTQCSDGESGEGGGSTYILPPATTNTLGGVKVGNGLSVTSDGTLSATGGQGGDSETGILRSVDVLDDEPQAEIGDVKAKYFTRDEDGIEQTYTNGYTFDGVEYYNATIMTANANTIQVEIYDWDSDDVGIYQISYNYNNDLSLVHISGPDVINDSGYYLTTITADEQYTLNYLDEGDEVQILEITIGNVDAQTVVNGIILSSDSEMAYLYSVSDNVVVNASDGYSPNYKHNDGIWQYVGNGKAVVGGWVGPMFDTIQSIAGTEYNQDNASYFWYDYLDESMFTNGELELVRTVWSYTENQDWTLKFRWNNGDPTLVAVENNTLNELSIAKNDSNWAMYGYSGREYYIKWVDGKVIIKSYPRFLATTKLTDTLYGDWVKLNREPHFAIPNYNSNGDYGIPHWNKDGLVDYKICGVNFSRKKLNTTGYGNTIDIYTREEHRSFQSWFIPTQPGTAGQVLTSAGDAEPQWATIIKAVKITAADYAALATKDPNTLYLIVG